LPDEALSDRVQLLIDRRRAAHPRKNRARLLLRSPAHEPARALGQVQHAHAKENCRQGADRGHPPPSAFAGKGEVDQERSENTQHEPQSENGDQPPAPVVRRDLGDVKGPGEGGQSKGRAHQQAAKEQPRLGRCQSGADRPGDPDDPAQDQRYAAPDAVDHDAAARRAEHRAQQRHADQQLIRGRRETEL